MDDILKKTMFTELKDVLVEIEDIVAKYNTSGDVVYTAAFGVVDEGDESNEWALSYGWNCRDVDEFQEFITLQIEAFSRESLDEEIFPGISLN
tara:strand:+ start:348 stop:626 length:279 start_codon:yes stop_codon:yes gene_type:complete